MIEQLLLDLGLKCGTVKNFNAVILEASRLNGQQRWYFLTPIKSKDNGSGYIESTISLAYPILANNQDIDEVSALNRIAIFEAELKNELITLFKRYVNVPAYTFSVIPFWANEKGERTERKTFGANNIHIINGQLTLKYRETWFNCNC